jgi:hypothetical protein
VTPTNKSAQSRQQKEKRGRTGALLLHLEDIVEDAIAVASIREQVRMFGIDHVRGI